MEFLMAAGFREFTGQKWTPGRSFVTTVLPLVDMKMFTFK